MDRRFTPCPYCRFCLDHGICIGQRVLPAFAGMRVLYSPRLMLASLLRLNTGCMLQVSSEASFIRELLAASVEGFALVRGMSAAGS
jgi:hypothetical protein